MSSETADRRRLGFVGGTGPEGRGLALRFGSASYPIMIGSRSQERAAEAAEELQQFVTGDIRGGLNADAARDGEIVFLTIPYAGLSTTLPPLEEALAGKIVVSAVAPVEFQSGRPMAVTVEAGSAAEEVQNLLPGSRVVSAFQIIDAHQLQSLQTPLDTDVVVCSDDVEARREIVHVAGDLDGVRALSGGRLSTSRYVEACTALLITINRIYKVHSGIRLTGVNR